MSALVFPKSVKAEKPRGLAVDVVPAAANPASVANAANAAAASFAALMAKLDAVAGRVIVKP